MIEEQDLLRTHPDITGESKKTLQKYFDAQLVTLMLHDRAHPSSVSGVGRIDFSPMWASQDPAGANVRIKPGSSEKEVCVDISYGTQGTERVVYRVTRTAVGWRISDIQGAIKMGDSQSSKWSLVQLLEGP